MSHQVQLLWIEGCANHLAARQMVEELVAELAPGTVITDVDPTDPAVAQQVRFPGSPTIRVDGRDVDPSYVDPGDYTPRCRLYRTGAGLSGIPDRGWIVVALTTGSVDTPSGQARDRRGGVLGSPSSQERASPD